MSEITRQDLIADDAIVAPLILSKNLMESVNTLDILIKKALEFNKVISSAESTTVLKKSINDLTAEQKELVKVQNQIDSVNAKNSDSYRELAKQLAAAKKEQKEKIALGEREATEINRQNASLIELRAALEKNRMAFSSLRTEEERATKEGKALLSVIQQQDKDLKELSADIGKHQDKVGDYEGALRKLKGELRAANSDMIGIAATLGTDSKEFVQAAEKAGKLKDELQDMNDAAKAVSGSPFENFGSSLGTVGSKLKNLDFKGAADTAKQFANVSKTITFKEATLGASHFGKTMLTLGKSLLTNPFVLLAAIIIGIAVAVVALKDKIKILSEAFDFVGAAMDKVVQAGKDFLDWIGASTFAADEKTQAIVDGAKKEVEAITDRYDTEIAIANAAGKKTVELERAKWKSIIAETEKAQSSLIEKHRDANRGLTEDDEKTFIENEKLIREANKELKIIEAREGAGRLNQQKEQNEKAKKLADDKAKALKELALREQGDLFKLQQFRLQNEIEGTNAILQNVKLSESERELALSEAIEARKKLAQLEFNNAMGADKLTGSAKILLREQLNKKLAEIDQFGVDERTKIAESETEKLKVEHEKALLNAKNIGAERVRIVENDVQNAIDAVKREVIAGVKTKEEGAKVIEAIQKDLADETVQANIDALESILLVEDLTAEERKGIEQELFDFRSKLTDTLYNQIAERGKTSIEKTNEDLQKVQEIYGTFASAAGGVFDSLTEQRMQNLELESEAVAEQMEQELLAAGENEVAKSEIKNDAARKQDELDKKKLAQQRKAAIFDKSISAVQAVIATLLAVTKAGVITPVAIATGIAGAATVAAILAKPIPGFWEGGEHKGGLLYVGEKGIELVEPPNKTPFLSAATSTLMNLPAGTKITDHETTMQQLAAGQLQYSRNYDRAVYKDYGKEIIKGFKSLEHVIQNKTETHWNMSRGDIKRAFKNAQTMTYFLDTYYR